uniref:Uncharacterized protein n=1 Tax=Thermodesulfobacterium geofontis TaxID=1295609 RepID=A0A7V6CD54_9BACT
MHRKDRIKKEFLRYKSLLTAKEEVFFSEYQKYVRLGDLREIQLFPPIYVVLVEEISYYNEKMYKAVVLTEEIPLGWLGESTPILRLKNLRTLLVALPFWIYLEESFLYRFSRRLSSLSEEEWPKLVEYAENKIIPETLQGEYIHLVMKRLAPYNTVSLLNYIEKLSAYEETPQIIQLSSKIAESLQEYEFQQAAASKNVFKGRNFLAVLERLVTYARLIIYLPQEYIGKNISIRIKGQKVFEGELKRDKVVLEPLPFFLDYSFLEEELDVQV